MLLRLTIFREQHVIDALIWFVDDFFFLKRHAGEMFRDPVKQQADAF